MEMSATEEDHLDTPVISAKEYRGYAQCDPNGHCWSRRYVIRAKLSCAQEVCLDQRHPDKANLIARRLKQSEGFKSDGESRSEWLQRAMSSQMKAIAVTLEVCIQSLIHCPRSDLHQDVHLESPTSKNHGQPMALQQVELSHDLRRWRKAMSD